MYSPLSVALLRIYMYIINLSWAHGSVVMGVGQVTEDVAGSNPALVT